MKMQKVNNCFNRKRQEHAREKVFDVKDGQVQKSDEDQELVIMPGSAAGKPGRWAGGRKWRARLGI